VLEEGADPDAVIRAAAPSEVAALDDMRAAVAVAVRPFVVAMLLFAALAALGALAAIGGSLARRAVADAQDAPLLFSLGAGRLQLATIAAGRVCIVGVVGVVTALTVAISLSPIFPLGPVAVVEPNPGVTLDVVVLVPGAAVLLAAVLTVGLVAGRRHHRRELRAATPGRLSRLLTPRLPVSGAIGVWMAFPPRGRARTLMRATLVPVTVAFVSGAVVAVFAASVDDLFEHPRRHGWNWDLAVTCQQGYCDIPVPDADVIATSAGVEAWTRLSFGRLDVGGIEIPVVGAGFGHGVTDAFTVVDGHPPASAEEIVLGGSTMGDLDVGVGDQLMLGRGGPTTRVVGRAVFAGLGPSDVARPPLGNGAGMTTQGLLNLEDQTELVDAVVLRVDGDPAPVADSLRHLMPNYTVLATQRPSALAAWPQLRRVPIVLSLLLAVLGIASLAHGVATSSRLHRKDLAVMGALGLRARRVAHAVFWQTLALFSFALTLSVPLGILLGVRAWHTLTDQLDLDSTAIVAPVTLGAGALAATMAVSTVAFLVARRATRRPAGMELHGD
jgi:putative ABC transport system permease protein